MTQHQDDPTEVGDGQVPALTPDAEATNQEPDVKTAEVADQPGVVGIAEGEADDRAAEVEPAEVEAEVQAAEVVAGEATAAEPSGDVMADLVAEGDQPELPVEREVLIDDETMRRALEAILMVSDEPLPVLTLARAVGRPTGDVTSTLATLSAEYTEEGRGFDLREVAGGWRFYTREDAAPYVERFVLDGQQARLTQAALETLAVVAYKQPVSRARVSAVRGVNVDGVMRTLVSRGLVEEAGADTESQATLYRTTTYFLERMGMQSLDELPELAPYLPEMEDLEEELAAHAAPPPDPDAPSDATGTDSDTASESGHDSSPQAEAAPELAETAEAGAPSAYGLGAGVDRDAGSPGGSWSNRVDD